MKAQKIVTTMLEKDYFSQWLGIKVLQLSEHRCRLSLVVKQEMLNGFGIAHGGITYSLADSALAFASNSGGRKSLSVETSITHILPVHVHDILIAEAECETQTEKLGHYRIKIFKQQTPETIVALFKGIVYKTSKQWEL